MDNSVVKLIGKNKPEQEDTCKCIMGQLRTMRRHRNRPALQGFNWNQLLNARCQCIFGSEIWQNPTWWGCMVKNSLHRYIKLFLDSHTTGNMKSQLFLRCNHWYNWIAKELKWKIIYCNQLRYVFTIRMGWTGQGQTRLTSLPRCGACNHFPVHLSTGKSSCLHACWKLCLCRASFFFFLADIHIYVTWFRWVWHLAKSILLGMLSTSQRLYVYRVNMSTKELLLLFLQYVKLGAARWSTS